MKKLKNAPLIYTIGLIKFPRIPAVDRFIDSFHDKIRSEYPLGDEFKISVLNADFGSQGVQFAQQENKVWQFTSVDQDWAFVLTDQSLCLHTVNYQDFSYFADRFKKGLNTLLQTPDIGIEWAIMIGLRYVNLVSAKGNDKLNDYLQPWILPPEPPQGSLTIIQGAHVTRYSTEIGELRMQVLKNPQFTLPPELQSPLIIKNEWVKNRPETDFALVDIDHSITFTHPVKITLSSAIKNLSDLNRISKVVFESTGTKLSHKSWGGK
jgi:uncharacterized protein (TIGR04255 family)